MELGGGQKLIGSRNMEGNLMRNIRLLAAMAMILLGAGCAPLPHGQSARRYAGAPFENDLTTSRFYLLDRHEVQRDLNLTMNQVAALAEAFNTPYEKIPGLGEWQARYRGLSQEEKHRQKSQYAKDREAISSTWLESQIMGILNRKQRDRLDALLLQMKGPRAITIIPGMIEKLRVTPERAAKIQCIIREHQDEWSPFYRQFGHNMLQRSRSNQTAEEAQKEQDTLVATITKILKSQDEAIMAELTKTQRDQWQEMQGQLLPVSWPETAGFYIPFADSAGRFVR
jgi:hypothetical protein